MTKTTDKLHKTVKETVIGHYDGSYTRDQLVTLLDEYIADVKDAVTEIKFEVVHEERWDPYDSNPYHKANLVLTYDRLETDEEYGARQALELKRKHDREEVERAEYERLRKQFEK